VGLTATPFRLDGKGLGDLFGDFVVPTTAAKLCDEGYLHAPKVYASKSPDLRGIRVTAGDYNLKALSERVDTPEQNAGVVEMWLKHGVGRRTVCFAVDIQHSHDIVAAFRQEGIAAEHLDGRTPPLEREAVLARLRAGVTQIVSNCMVLTEGWDLPALEVAIIARPTASLNLHLQMIGRTMRAVEGKYGCLVLDHAGNHHVHGMVTRKLVYSLDGKTKGGHADPLGARRCPACGLFFDWTLSACPECGWMPTAAGTRDRPAIYGDGVLDKFDDSSFEYRKDFWISTEAMRMASGYLPGWSRHRFHERFGEWPVIGAGELVDVENATMDEKRAVHEDLLANAKAKGFKLGWAAHQFRKIFGVWPRTGIKRDQCRQELESLVYGYRDK
ncbi:MAG: hypothetical protein HQ592_07500, partial [Planctomycetes bacterium]|nr:hypothetical protein [Planctomycetota bacterium]